MARSGHGRRKEGRNSKDGVLRSSLSNDENAHRGILRPIRLIAVVVWLATPAVFAERPSFDFGLRAGRPQTAVVDVQRNQYFSVFGGSDFVEDPGYTVGPTIRVNLTSRVGNDRPTPP